MKHPQAKIVTTKLVIREYPAQAGSPTEKFMRDSAIGRKVAIGEIRTGYEATTGSLSGSFCDRDFSE